MSPSPFRQYQVEDGIDLDDLVEKGLARQSDSENYDVHDLVKNFLWSMDEVMKTVFTHQLSIGTETGKIAQLIGLNLFITSGIPETKMALQKYYSPRNVD